MLVGVYPGVTIVAAGAVSRDKPSTLPKKFLELGRGRRLPLHAQHSVVDWTAFAIWDDGALVRSLSVSGEGFFEDLGERQHFEEAFWSPEEAYAEDVPHGHPLDLGEAALLALLGFQYEGMPSD